LRSLLSTAARDVDDRLENCGASPFNERKDYLT